MFKARETIGVGVTANLQARFNLGLRGLYIAINVSNTAYNEHK